MTTLLQRTTRIVFITVATLLDGVILIWTRDPSLAPFHQLITAPFMILCITAGCMVLDQWCGCLTSLRLPSLSRALGRWRGAVKSSPKTSCKGMTPTVGTS